MDQQDPQELLEFPCHYQFKAVGMAGDAFKEDIFQAVKAHANISHDAVLSRMSGKGTYQSVSVLVTLHSYRQLTDIYASMKAVNGLKMLL